MKNFCTNCGTKLEENSKFCHNCGGAIYEESEQDIDDNAYNNNVYEESDEDRKKGMEAMMKYLEKKWENEDDSNFFLESKNSHKVYDTNNLPIKKIRKFIKKNINENESVILDDSSIEILYFYDSTVFGSGDNGFLILKWIINYWPIYTLTCKELFLDSYTIFLNVNKDDQNGSESIYLSDLEISKNKIYFHVNQDGQFFKLPYEISEKKVVEELFECVSRIFRGGDIRNNVSNDPANIREN
ncbi:zinc ribbon domain-containing protein [Chryseobacterium sp. Hurlbut01]|uniref:zinc ribbon domain-containing protein n=1 Tax=Chryseobacterium sp. Hurlbut01 TaxID=1681828 RepID=UPI00067D9AD7|nr:zinc ribbon domain-containing protein [Chryseobacterium sp. Hurlbut01]KNB62900.1 hypothetical protein AC804_02400 [Chryseobacterium sp. Hurlbut01]